MTPTTHPDLLVDAQTNDDAAVWRLDDQTLLVASADFFAPIVDDARTWGRIAAANAASDIYAMGATPLFALNLAGWPRDTLPLDLLSEVLAGGSDAAAEGGWVVVGGHTIDAPEPLYGMSVTGICKPTVSGTGLLTNAGGRPGQALVLTKPLCTGVIATAVKHSNSQAVARGGSLHDAYDAAVSEMCRLNDSAAAVAIKAEATAATDVTGFGLLGHLAELADASGVNAVVDASAVPVLTDAVRLINEGFVPAGTGRNLSHLNGCLSGGNEITRTVLADPQTSGGLLFCCQPGQADTAVRVLRESGHDAAVIGELTDRSDGRPDDTFSTITIIGTITGTAAGD